MVNHNGRIVMLTARKGGVGKTADNVMLSVVASQLFHKKVLLIDYDQQHNSTLNISATYQTTKYRRSLVAAVEDGDWESAITRISDNLYLIAGTSGNEDLANWLSEKYPDVRKRRLAFMDQMARLREKFDYVFIDCPPSADNAVRAFLVASDFVVALQELKKFAVEGTKDFINDVLAPLVQEFPESKLQVLGILPVLFSPRRVPQRKNYDYTVEHYGRDNTFQTIIKGSDRIEQYGEEGVKLDDYIDRRWWGVFADIFSEIEERITYFDKHGDWVGYEYTLQYADSMNNHILDKGREIPLEGIKTLSREATE